MLSECNECGRPAVAYWGSVAWCKAHLAAAKAEDPVAHECPQCGAEQPANVSWHRSSPCGTCKAQKSSEPAVGAAGSHKDQPNEDPKSSRRPGRRKPRRPWPGELTQRPLID